MTDKQAPSLPPVEAQLRRIVEEMRSEKPRYKSHDLGYVDSVSSNLVDTWADELEAVLAVLAAIPSPQTWQAIETAPKDGEPILIDFGPSGIHRVFWSEEPFGKGIGAWCLTDGKNEDRPLRGYGDQDVKAWMLLPVASLRGGPAKE